MEFELGNKGETRKEKNLLYRKSDQKESQPAEFSNHFRARIPDFHSIFVLHSDEWSSARPVRGIVLVIF